MIVRTGTFKTVGQTGRVETQVRVQVAVISPNSAGWQTGNLGRLSVL
jgi:hypothetical protein